jgi:hypothetical protein
MVPGAAAESVHDPQHREQLQIAGTLDAADVGHRPSEGGADFGHLLLRRFVVSADEHVRGVSRELRPDHVSIADDVERLDHARLGQPALDLLPARVRVTERELGRTCCGRIERIRRVDHHLACQIPRAGEPEGALRAGPECREDRDFGERRRFGECACRGSAASLLHPRARLLAGGLPRTHHDLVSEPHQPLSEGLADDSRTQHPDLHRILLAHVLGSSDATDVRCAISSNGQNASVALATPRPASTRATLHPEWCIRCGEPVPPSAPRAPLSSPQVGPDV